MLQAAILAIALLCSAIAVLMAIWIVVPAPNPEISTFAVAFSEWSIWLALLGAIGVAFAMAGLRLGSHWMGWVAAALGVAAVGCGLIPLFQALPVARAHGVSLRLPGISPSDRDPLPNKPPQRLMYAAVAGQPLMLDSYSPPAPGSPASAHGRAAIVVVHGGGWRGGARSETPQWNRRLAELGYAVFDVDYRLAPQPNWQAAIGDVKCAIGWVRRNAAQYGVDPSRIALLGRSAGGHLALLAAYTPDEAALAPSCDSGDTSVRAVVGLYAPTDLAWGYDHPANLRAYNGPESLSAFLGGDPRTAAERYVLNSPTSHIGPTTPPTLLIHGGKDQLVRVENATRLDALLGANGVPHTTVVLPYGQHSFDHVDGWSSQIVGPVLRDFLAAHL